MTPARSIAALDGTRSVVSDRDAALVATVREGVAITERREGEARRRDETAVPDSIDDPTTTTVPPARPDSVNVTTLVASA